MPITALPTPPQRNDPANFATRGDAFMAALPTFTTEANALAADVNAKQVLAATSETNAATSETNAANSAASALASSNSAINAPGTNATSTSNLSVSAGTKVFTLVQTGKLFNVGQRLVFARTSDPVNTRMVGYLGAFNPGTGVGSLLVGSGDFIGTGSFTDWTVSMAGEGNNLPVPVSGDIGKLVGVQVAGQYALVDGRGAGASTPSAGNITLTNTSAAVQKVTAPTTPVPLQFVKLPDATTMPLGLGIFSIENATGVDVEIRDDNSLALGYIRPGTTAIINLIDKSTAAGVWGLVGTETFGVIQTGVTATTGVIQSVTAIDSTRDLVVYSSAAGTSGIVWDNSAGVFGTAVLLTATVPISTVGLASARSVKLDTDKLFVGVTAGTNSIGVVLTISGTSITPGTAGSGPNPGADRFNDMVALDNGTVVFVFGTTSPSLSTLACAISGTTVTFGALVPNMFSSGNFATTNVASLLDLTGGRFLIVAGLGAWSQVGTVNPTTGTITLGTAVTITNAASLQWAIRRLPSGRFALITISSSTMTGHILSISGTTITFNSATLVASNGEVLGCAHVIGNQVLVAASVAGAIATVTYNVLTDNAGTAVAGTALITTNPSGTSTGKIAMIGYDDISITTFKPLSNTSTGDNLVYRVGINGNNPALLSTQMVSSTTGGVPLPNDNNSSSNAWTGPFGRHTAVSGAIFGSKGSIDISGVGGSALAWRVSQGYATIIVRPLVPALVNNSGNTTHLCRGDSNSQIWCATRNNTGTTLTLVRIKVA